MKSSELASVVDGLYMESVDVTYSGYGQPKSEDNGKQLTCTASSENHSETRSSSVIVEVHCKCLAVYQVTKLGSNEVMK